MASVRLNKLKQPDLLEPTFLYTPIHAGWECILHIARDNAAKLTFRGEGLTKGEARENATTLSDAANLIIEIREALAYNPSGTTIEAIAKHFNKPPPEIYAILRKLCNRGEAKCMCYTVNGRFKTKWWWHNNEEDD